MKPGLRRGQRPQLRHPFRWCEERGCHNRCMAPHVRCARHRPESPRRKPGATQRWRKRPEITLARRSAGLAVAFEGC